MIWCGRTPEHERSYLPLFVTDGKGVKEPIAALPGVERLSIDGIVEKAHEAVDLGIRCLALFPHTDPSLKTQMLMRRGIG